MIQLGVHLKNALSHQDCDSLVSMYDNTTVPAEIMGEGNDPYKSSIRSSQVSPIECRDFTNKFNDMIKFSNRESFGFDISIGIDSQYVRYESKDKGYYDWHIDTFQPPFNPPFNRKLTLICMLSDQKEYEGGELELTWDKINLDKGDVFIFPSFFPHKVNTVTKGTRRVAVTWAEGLEWR